MIIKTYRAESTAAALKMVREELGGDAYVLKTREVDGSSREGRMEVTACLENGDASDLSPTAKTMKDRTTVKTESDQSMPVERVVSTPETIDAQVVPVVETRNDKLDSRIDRIEKRLDQIFNLNLKAAVESDKLTRCREIINALKQADVPSDFLDAFMMTLIEMDESDIADVSLVQGKLVSKLSTMMVPDLAFKPGDRVLFVGPAGAGKSSLMGKLAAQLVATDKRKVRLVTLDDVKIGAIDEIGSYADLLGADLTEEKEIVRSGSDTITLIDTPALPRDDARVEKLAKKIKQARPTCTLAVFSAITRSDDIPTLAMSLKAMAPTHVAVTMTDLTDRLGSMIAATAVTGLKLAYTTNSPGGAGSINAPDPDMVARKLLGTGVVNE